jgi:hypothetical protein
MTVLYSWTRIDAYRRRRRFLDIAPVCFWMLCLPTFCVAAAEADQAMRDSSMFLDPVLAQGQTISQVFSRTVSTRVEGFDSTASRISGTGSYRLSAVTQNQFLFGSQFLYDGRPLAAGVTKIRRDGAESCWQDTCGPSTDASGLLFNSLLWGTAPKRIGIGTRWHTRISVPWELGPPGDEEVTVTALDASTGSVTLLRRGSGEGFFDNDSPKFKLTRAGKEYVLEAKPGIAHWSGYTTFARGVVINDELLVERSLLLFSTELGNRKAMQRQYVILSQSPQPSWEGA